MSWSPELYIGGSRPWPDSVLVVRSQTDERSQYIPETGCNECEIEYVTDWLGWHCKACDTLWQGLRDQKPRFCQHCGAKVAG